MDYYDPNGKRFRKNFKKKKDAVAELGKRESLKVEGRYLDVKKEYDTTLKQLIDLYKKNFSQQPSFNTAKIFFIKRYKEYFGTNKRLPDIRYRDLETYRSYLKQQLTAYVCKSFCNEGRDLKALQEILGHTTLAMTIKYAHLAQGHKKEAINRLNGLTTKKPDSHKIVTIAKNEKSATV